MQEREVRSASGDVKPKAILLDDFGTVVEKIEWLIEQTAGLIQYTASAIAARASWSFPS